MKYIPREISQRAKEIGAKRIKMFVVGDNAYYSLCYGEKGKRQAVGLPTIYTMKDGKAVELTFNQVKIVLSKVNEDGDEG